MINQSLFENIKQLGGLGGLLGGVAKPSMDPHTVLTGGGCLSSHAKGTALELAVAQKLLLLGCEVFLPLLHSSQADLVCITPVGKKIAIQVKTAWLNAGRKGRAYPMWAKKAKNGRAKYDHIDFFVWGYEGEFWVVPDSYPYPAGQFGPNSQHKEAWHLITDL